MITIVNEGRERAPVERADIVPVVQAIVGGHANDALVELGALFQRDSQIVEWIEQARFAAKRAIA